MTSMSVSSPTWIAVEDSMPPLGKSVLVRFNSPLSIDTSGWNAALHNGHHWTLLSKKTEVNPTYWLNVPKLPRIHTSC